MKISLINKFDSVESAWKYSRPALKKIDIDLIRTLDLPVNEFCVFYLKIECTIAEREVFASSRKHVMWAQGSRINEPIYFTYDSDLFHDATPEHYNYMEYCRERMRDTRENGVRQDDYRLGLPVLSFTKFNLIISARDFLSIMSAMEEIYSASTGIISLTFNKAVVEIDKFMEAYSNYNVISTNMKSKLDLFPREKSLRGNASTSNFSVVSFSCNMSLRAQMVRHRGILFVDDFFVKLVKKDGWKMTQASEINMQISGANSMLREIASKRSCWIAQYNIWKNPIRAISSSLVITENDLPCGNGKPCPFSADANARYTDADPNPPCPIHAIKNKIVLNESQVKQATDLILTDERPNFWLHKLREKFE